MKVILLTHIEKLGNQGDVVNVKRGYARNYLIPRELAIYATPQNLKKLGDIKQKAAAEEEIRLSELRLLAERISAQSLVFIRKVDEHDTMFGSVSDADIVTALEEMGISIQKSAIQLEKHIKELGQSQIEIKLHKNITAQLSIDIRKETQPEPAPQPVPAEPEEQPEPEVAPEPEDQAQPEEPIADAAVTEPETEE